MLIPLIHEVGMRDGLQMEQKIVEFDHKVRWIEGLIGSGIPVIQLGSFVHPKYVPQMADTDALFRHFTAKGGKRPTFSGLVLNEKGMERGLACGVDLFCLGVSASETHSLKNTRMPVMEALERILAMARTLQQEGRKVQVSVQSAFGCGFEGPIAEAKVLSIVDAYLEAGLKNISLADTAGHADPRQVASLFSQVIRRGDSIECTCHLHNTFGMGIANCLAAYDSGVQVFESAFGGLGGCPFTAVAGGNVATEDLVHMFSRLGIETGIDLDPVIATSREAADQLEHDLPGCVYKTGPISFQQA
ncbi:MAG: hydroxymethylglutaryl-CoA lyase [Acidobacteriota bacterium]|nr:MAG: hydroxymethylglutaryl-CoA lyase [Acidobacteriota bacterium]